MLKRKPMAPVRSLKPEPEGLEGRQLLSKASIYGQPTAQVRGTDPDGAHWTLRLYGPGTLNVVDQNGNPFTKANANIPDLINTITVAGAITSETRLVGTVVPGPSGDSNVHFQNLIVTPTGELPKIDQQQVNNFRIVQDGILAIDMPNFYLAHTSTSVPSTASQIHTSAKSAGLIYIPGGVINLRFGGVNADYTPPGGTPLNKTGQSNEFQINLGLPITTGTSIIVNTITTDAQANTTSGSLPFQEMATFLVTGRLNLFQAKQINGNTTLAPSQFASTTPTNGLAPGGTYVISQGGPVTGQIGTVRVTGAATNFTTLITENAVSAISAEGELDAKISTFYVGGQTNNVMLIAPSGSRNVFFGLGMDNVTINSLAISTLQANRDATNSSVTVSRSIQNMVVGGDVNNTNVDVGAAQSLFSYASFPSPNFLTTSSGAFFGTPPPTITDPQVNVNSQLLEPYAQNGGFLGVRVAGNITNSVFAASVDPNPSGSTTSLVGTFQKPTSQLFPYGAPSNLVLPRGVINARVEGKINNSTNPLVAPGQPSNAAFFARIVHKFKGPVIPPNVPYLPYNKPFPYHTGQRGLKGLFQIDHYPPGTSTRATPPVMKTPPVTHPKKK